MDKAREEITKRRKRILRGGRKKGGRGRAYKEGKRGVINEDGRGGNEESGL